MKKQLRWLASALGSGANSSLSLPKNKSRLKEAKKAPLSGLIAGALTFLLLLVFVLTSMADWIVELTQS